MDKYLTRIELLEKDNLRLQKLCRESLVLVKTFYNLASSDQKKIIFSDRYDVHQFLRGLDSLEYRLSRELSRVLM